MFKHLGRIVFFLVLVFLLGCSSGVTPPAGYDYDVPVHRPHKEAPTGRAASLPWETWPLQVDLQGGEIKNFYILRGDDLVFQGKREQALTFYQQAVGRSLEPESKQALVLRIASCQLALDQPQAALRTVGQFFNLQGLDESRVDPRFSLVLAFAYGRRANWDQSLAWFSRAQRISTGSISIKRAAESGTELLLRSLPDIKLEELANQWQADPFVYTQIAQEKRRRGLHGIVVGSAENRKPFWELGVGDTGPSDTGRSVSADSGLVGDYKIGVLLPLTGRFASLGKNTKNGIELALLSSPGGVKVRAIYKDTAGDVETAIREFGNLVEKEQVNLVVGPLLADVASALLPLAAERKVPLITFSKRTDLQLGNGLFRLGATVESQIDSLLGAVQESMKLTQLALVYPESADGLEYANVFRAKAYALGMQIVYDKSYFPKDTQALTQIALEIPSVDAQGVFFPDSVDRAAVFISTLPEQVRQRIRILGPASWDNPTAISNARSVLNGAVFVSPFFQRSSEELVSKFNASYQSKYGAKPDFLSAQGFDAATMALAAFRREVQEGMPFLDSFNAISDYRGLTGEIRLNPDGEIQREFVVVSLQDSELVSIWPLNQASSGNL